MNPDIWTQSTEKQNVILNDGINLLFSIPIASGLLRGSHICMIYQIDYIIEPKSKCNSYLVLALIDGQIGISVVNQAYAPTHMESPFINKIKCLLFEGDNLHLITPLSKFYKEFGLDATMRMYVDGWFIPGDSPTVCIHTFIHAAPVSIPQSMARPISTRGI